MQYPPRDCASALVIFILFYFLILVLLLSVAIPYVNACAAEYDVLFCLDQGSLYESTMGLTLISSLIGKRNGTIQTVLASEHAIAMENLPSQDVS